MTRAVMRLRCQVLRWSRTEHAYQAKLAFIELAVFFLTIFAALMVCASTYSPPPLQQSDGGIIVTRYGDIHMITETRHFTGTRRESISFTRKVYKDDDPKQFFLVGGGMITSKVGDFTLVRAFALPPTRGGRWCSQLTSTWWPSLSQVEFEAENPDICFELEPW